MLTYSRESEIVQEALRRGAGGYLVHGEFTADQLVAAVRDIKEGRAHFTPTAAGALLEQLRQAQPQQAARGGVDRLPDDLGNANAHAGGLPTASRVNAYAENLSQVQPDVGQSSSGWTGGRPAAVDRSRFQLSVREAEIMDSSRPA